MEWDNLMTISFLSDLVEVDFTNDYKDLAIKGKIFYEVVRFMDKFEKLKNEILNTDNNLNKTIIDIYADRSLMNVSVVALNELLSVLKLRNIVYWIDIGFINLTSQTNIFKEIDKQDFDYLRNKFLNFEKKLYEAFVENISGADNEYTVMFQTSIYYDIKRNYINLKEKNNKEVVIRKHQEYVKNSINTVKKLLDKEEIIKIEIMVSKNIDDPKIISNIYKLILSKYFLAKNEENINDFYIKKTLEIVDKNVNNIVKDNPKLLDVVNYIEEEVKNFFSSNQE